VRVAVLESAHVCLWGKPRLAIATLFSVCFGVQYGFLRTPSTCLYVETGGMCMWRYIETAKKAQEYRQEEGQTSRNKD
jgi:hypothetical protein